MPVVVDIAIHVKHKFIRGLSLIRYKYNGFNLLTKLQTTSFLAYETYPYTTLEFII